MNVPDLKKKLQFLYQRSEAVHSHKALANRLNINPNNISVWINGQDDLPSNRIPDRHISKFCQVFGLDPKFLGKVIEDFADSLLRQPVFQDRPWHTLLTAAIPDGIQLIQLQRPGSRGLERYDPDQPMVEYIPIMTPVYLALTLKDDRLAESKIVEPYTLLLSVDEEKTACVWPNQPISPSRTKLSAFALKIPAEAPQKGFRVAGPKGEQSVLALVTAQPLEEELYALLQAKNIEPVLDPIATFLKAKNVPWLLLKKVYQVY
ncbi:MAG: hypothetical protein ACRERU_04770 [Methylococcales bacterium]